MSVPFAGSITRSGGLSSALKKQIRLSNLKAVKSVTAKYDPWHDKCPHASARGFLIELSTRAARDKNPDCKISSVIVNDRSEPLVTCDLVNGETVIIKTANFSTLELLQLFNKHVTPYAPVETVTTVLKKKKK